MIKIISWNVRHGLGQDGIVDIKRIGETLKSLNADIIALQEIDVNAKRSNGVNQPKVLAEILGYDYHFTSFAPFAVTPFTSASDSGYGLLTLSKLPMVKKQDLIIADLKCNNTAQLITFAQRQARFDFVNLHAPFHHNKKYWKNFYKDYDFTACILCGDFNLLAEDPAILNLKQKYQSLNEASTFCRGDVWDYTFLPKTPYRMLSQTVIDSDLSDHNILVTTFDLW